MDVSEAAAGALDNITFGLSNEIAGVNAIRSDAYWAGSILSNLNPKGAFKAAGRNVPP